ncbi:MAG: hypothetical protein HZA58_04550 [Acidimicrobiia bacterium]|nr:hypothetical protein [Acidimicrobiia bacterium]
MSRTSCRFISALAVLLVTAAACGDDDAATSTTATATTAATTTAATSPTTAPPAPTELRFTFEGVAGAQGKILVGTVFGEGGALAATICEPVASDPFSGAAVAATAAPDNPCGHDAPYGVPLTTDGVYSYMVAIYTGGSQTAELCAFGEVIVDGPTEVVIAAADLTADNCNA